MSWRVFRMALYRSGSGQHIDIPAQGHGGQTVQPDLGLVLPNICGSDGIDVLPDTANVTERAIAADANLWDRSSARVKWGTTSIYAFSPTSLFCYYLYRPEQ